MIIACILVTILAVIAPIARKFQWDNERTATGPKMDKLTGEEFRFYLWDSYGAETVEEAIANHKIMAANLTPAEAKMFNTYSRLPL